MIETFTQFLKKSPLILLLYLLGTGAVNAGVTASFSVSDTVGCSPLTIKFTNNSSGATSYYWDFGNGNTSTLTTPSNVYTVAGKYTVKLVATDASGNKDSMTQTSIIRVVADPLADFSAADTTVCPTISVSFTNNSSNSSSWIWDFGDGNSSSNQNPSHSYNASGYYTVKLIAKNAYGCSNAMSKSKYIYVYKTPISSFSVNVTDACDTTQLFSFTDKTSSPYSWKWDFGDGNNSTSQNPSHKYSSPGTYTIKLTTTNSYGCKGTLTQSNYISVDSITSPPFGATATTGCSPFPTSFKGPASAKSYSWDFGDSTTGTGTGSSMAHTYKKSGTFDVKMTIVTSKGCTRETTKTSYITVKAKPKADYTVSKTSACKFDAIQFTNNSTGAVKYLWDFGDGAQSTATSPTHSYIAAGKYTVMLKATNSGGCSDIDTIKNAVIITSPQSNFSVSKTTGCNPLTVSFSDSSVSATSWAWDFGDSSTSTSQNPSHKYTSLGTYNVTLIAGNAAGCKDTLTKKSYISVNNLPTSYVAPAAIKTCAPYSATFQDPSTGTVSWAWDFGDGTTSTDSTPTHVYKIPGTYKTSLTALKASGCKLVISNYKTFIIKGATADFTLKSTECPPFAAAFKDTIPNIKSWYWDFGDGATSTLQSPTHTYSTGGYYTVSHTITTKDGCSNTDIQSNIVYFKDFSASFTFVELDSTFPQRVAFTGTATGATSYSWDFGDSTTSTSLSPTHKYKYKKDYDVKFTIMNAKCTLSVGAMIYNVTIPPTGKKSTGGSGTGTTGGGTVKKNAKILSCAPVSVNFKDTSSNGTSWAWDFGDSSTSTAQNPTHRYTKAGIYDVKVIVKTKTGKVDTTVYKSYVQVNSPVARFNYSQINTCQYATLKLKDSSSNASSMYWDFGNGDSATGSKVTYAYKVTGKTNTVTLTVEDTIGCTSQTSKNIVAGVVNAISVNKTNACYSDTVVFKTSLSTYKSYYWSFGDSTHSTSANPKHNYDSAGTYTVKLTVSDTGACTRTYQLGNAIIIDRPNVGFTGDTTRGCTSLTVNFDNSTNGTYNWYWDFGDGNYSYRRYPTHTYSKTGLYTVTMSAEKNGCSASITKKNYIQIEKPAANFTFTQNTSCFPITVSFKDSSHRARSWVWNFGDKDTSHSQNPTHIFTKAPAGDVILDISDSNGCTARVTKPVIHFLSAKFAAKNTAGCVPWTSAFIDSSVDATSWYWSFGDGDTSHSQNPKHLYKNAGKYDITLVVSHDGACSDTMSKAQYMSAYKPISDFYTNDKASCAPSYVTFRDTSVDASAWVWDFGDGGASTLRNPSHIYNKPGLYTVKLKIKNKIGCIDSMVKINYIRVLGPVTSIKAVDSIACGIVNMQFTDASKGAVSWQWNFGDGSTSYDENPSHTYENTGKYTVSLITKDSSNCKALYTYPNKITINPKPVANFHTIDTMGCAPYTIDYKNSSTAASEYYWNFGDGVSSTMASPTHTYDSSGEFKIYMVAKNHLGCSDTMYYGKSLHVNPSPKSEFKVNVNRGCSPLFITFTNQFHSDQKVDFYWDFGNGTTSTDEDPKVTFVKPGLYDVHLVTQNNYGCTDTTTKKNFIEVFPTTPPVSSYTLGVSVVSDSKTSIRWDSSQVRNFGAYNIYRLNANTGQYERIQHITNRFANIYIDNGLNTLYNTYTYKVQTEDMCGNALPLDSLIAHTTINVTAKASKENVLVAWTPYHGCTVSRYEVYRTQLGTADTQFVGSTSPDTTFILDSGYICPVYYYYKIKATSLCGNNIVSWSDTSVAKPDNLLNQQMVDITRSTVVDDAKILTEWKAPLVAPSKISKYNIYRSEDNSNFEFISSVPNYQLSFVDSSVDVHKQNYYYKVIPFNNCSIHGADGQYSSSILLTARTDRANEKILIDWTPYMQWKDDVDYYIIEKLKQDGSWEVFKQVNGKTLRSEDEK